MTPNAHAVGRNTSRLLDVMHVANTSVRFKPFETIFAQGDSCTGVMYLEKGRVTLTTTSHQGRAAVVGILTAGAFFGEGALAGQRRRRATAKATTGSTVGMVKTGEMRRCLHEETAFADWFRSHMLARNISLEADLVDQLFNRLEKRLARTLLLLARYAKGDPHPTLPKISQETLAEMIGATRSRVNFFMNKFRKLGLIEYNGGLKVNNSLLTIVLHD